MLIAIRSLRGRSHVNVDGFVEGEPCVWVSRVVGTSFVSTRGVGRSVDAKAEAPFPPPLLTICGRHAQPSEAIGRRGGFAAEQETAEASLRRVMAITIDTEGRLEEHASFVPS